MIKNNLIKGLSIIFVATLIAGCNSEPATTLSTGINVQTAKQMIVQNEDVVILDVRTPKEFARGHIKGAVNINIHDPAFPQLASTLDRDKLYIVHCAVNPRGGRGDKSINIMNQLGFANTLTMDGGLKAWKRAGLPISNT